jgi:hypothetical protein
MSSVYRLFVDRCRLVMWGLIITLLMGALIGAKAPAADITYYTGGEDSIALSSIDSAVDYSLPFSGTTKLQTLMLKIVKANGSPKSSTIPLKPDGSFNVVYLFNDGPGAYKVTIFGSPQADSLSYNGVGYFNVQVSGSVPTDLPGRQLNDNVIQFVNSVMGKTVGRGECWDAAQAALDSNGADWTRPFSYGLPLDPTKDEILPGDIMQFYVLKTTEKLPNGGTRWETYGDPDHTAIIYQVLGKMDYQLAHQNLGGKRFMQITELNLANVTSGKYWIYRPVAGMLLQ